MTKNIMDKNDEKGYIIVEAAIVFPVMFFVLLFIIFIGNLFFEQARVDSIVMKHAVHGAECVADPHQYEIELGNIPTDVKGTTSEPYRYLLGSMTDLERKISDDVYDEIESSSMVFFSNSRANNLSSDYKSTCAKLNQHFFYSTFSVQVNYEIKFPIRFLMSDNATLFELSSMAEIPVDDAPEFIRNVDYAINLLDETKIGKSLDSMFSKMNDFIKKFTKKGE